MPFPPEDEKKYCRHEQAHMKGWHSLDILLGGTAGRRLLAQPSDLPLQPLPARSARIPLDDYVLEQPKRRNNIPFVAQSISVRTPDCTGEPFH